MTSITPAFTLGSIAIRQVESLYCLNDLHTASGGEKRHQPSDFLRIDQTKALIDEISSSADSRNIAVKVVRGKGKAQGTYACRELVVAYAAWISPAFHLKVLRVFLDAAAPAAAPYTAGPRDSLTAEQATAIRDLLTDTVKKLPKEKQAGAIIQGWSKLKSHFGVSYRKIPQGEFAEALSIVARHCVEQGELLDAPPPAALPDPLTQMKPPTFTTPDRNGDAGAKRTIGHTHDLLHSLQKWAATELPSHVRPAFGAALIEIVLITGWTEVDEALRELRSAQRATNHAMSYLTRWNEGGGYGIPKVQFYG
jgi:hypothetical protein